MFSLSVRDMIFWPKEEEIATKNNLVNNQINDIFDQLLPV